MPVDSGGIGARDLLTVEFDAVYDAAEANLAGMTQEDLLVQPSVGGNCANWILSHLVHSHNGIMATLGEPPVWDNDALAAPRSAPIVDPRDALDFDELRRRFLDSRQRCLHGIENMSDDALARPLRSPAGGTWTVAQLLAFLAFHQGYHVGQLGLARRAAGHQGAIRGPAPKESAATTPRTQGPEARTDPPDEGA